MSSRRSLYQLALSGKKTLFRPKESTVRFRLAVVEPIEECADATVAYVAEPINNEWDNGYPLSGELQVNETEKKWYHADLYGNKAVEVIKPSEDGNVVLGFTSDTYLMLDVDFQWLPFVEEFAIRYAKFHKLGSVLILKTSDDYLTDFFGNKLGKYCVIFGNPLSWKEIQWHITEARRLGIIERAFTKLRQFGFITIRVNSKNKKTLPPKIIKFYANGNMRGIKDYVQFRNRFRNLGFYEGNGGD